MVVNKVIDLLKGLGFSEYEAKAFSGLLSAYPATAYEIAKTSGIPTSRIYQIIERLFEKGLILKLAENEKTMYVPMDLKEFVTGYRKDVEKSLSALESELARGQEQPSASYIWNIRDLGQVMNKAERMVASAQKTLLVSGWHEELAVLEPFLRQAEKREVKIGVVHFGLPLIGAGQVYRHPIEDTIYQEKGGRALIVVTDSEEALMGIVFGNDLAEGATSRNKGFVLLAEDYVKHDIYIMKIVTRFDGELIARFGPNYGKLRDVYTDKEEQS
jgi:HTH-type transcriptional regulator, sugar sensing transcriptional regulator